MEARRCEFVESEDAATCLRCGRTVLSPVGVVVAACPASPMTGGPGSKLSKYLSFFGFTASGECKCRKRAALMDAGGPDWCDANEEEILDWLREVAEERGVVFFRPAARVILRRAIAAARRESAGS